MPLGAANQTQGRVGSRDHRSPAPSENVWNAFAVFGLDVEAGFFEAKACFRKSMGNPPALPGDS